MIDSETGDILTNVRVMYMNVTSSGKVTAEITVTDIELSLQPDEVRVTK